MQPTRSTGPADAPGSSSMGMFGVALVAVVCIVVIVGSLYFIITNWNTEDRAESAGAPPPAQPPMAPPFGKQQDPGPKVGEEAPDIAGEDIDGKPFKLSDYRGKVVMLDFWGHW